jgi:hypothetical protein
MSALVAVETAVLAVLVLLVAGLLRSHAEILRRLHELGAGPEASSREPAPGVVDFRVRADVPAPPADRDRFTEVADISGRGLADDALSIPVARVRHRTLLAFLTSGCTTCRRFWEAFADPRLELPGDLRLVIITHDAEHESPSAVTELAPADVPVVMSERAWSDYDVPGAPYFVLVDGGSVRGEGTGPSWEQVRALLGQATGDEHLAHRTVSLTDVAESREARIDEELLGAGIHPGHASLYAGDGPLEP